MGGTWHRNCCNTVENSATFKVEARVLETLVPELLGSSRRRKLEHSFRTEGRKQNTPAELATAMGPSRDGHNLPKLKFSIITVRVCSDCGPREPDKVDTDSILTMFSLKEFSFYHLLTVVLTPLNKEGCCGCHNRIALRVYFISGRHLDATVWFCKSRLILGLCSLKLSPQVVLMQVGYIPYFRKCGLTLAIPDSYGKSHLFLINTRIQLDLLLKYEARKTTKRNICTIAP